MPSLNWDDVVEITHDEAKQAVLDLLDSVGFTATSWQEGDPALAFVEVTAEVWAQVSKIGVFLKGAFLNATSNGEALTNFSDSFYDNQRFGAVPAQRLVTLACASTAGPYTIAPDGTHDVVLQHPDGPTYRLIPDGVTVFPLTLTSGGTLSGLLFEAEIAGSDANKAPNTVTILLTTLAGVTVASDANARSGNDAEPDPTLKLRNKTKWALLTKYELIDAAVRNICIAAGGGAITDAVVNSTNPRGAGTFDVYITGELETATTPDVDAAQAAIDRYVFGSSATPKTALVFPAPSALLNITGTVYYQGSYEPADIEAATQAALEDFVRLVPLGGFDFHPGPSNVVPINDVETAIKNAKVSDQEVKKTVQLTDLSGGGNADLSITPFGKVQIGTVNLTFTRVTG
jgi:hypothetical protein